MIRIYFMLALGVVAVVSLALLLGVAATQRRRKRRIEQSVGWRRLRSDEQGPRVRSLLNIYLDMVTKHGPGSEEAKAFRFGAEATLSGEDDERSDDLADFNRQADLIDEAARRLASGR
jgi:hypothetical protein